MAGIYHFKPSQRPLLVSIPHAGTRLSPGLEERLNPQVTALPDTDWFVDRLYGETVKLGAGLISARYSRYVVDLNRPPDDARLYAGKTTGLVPLSAFSGEPLYTGEPPGSDETEDRVRQYHEPYHQAIKKELRRLHSTFGYALLLDAHSIRSEVPMLFDGKLPDLNLGTFDGRSADTDLVQCAQSVFARQSRFSHVLNGRFKGGFITRHYGRPEQGVHALQLEMAQAAYMRESPPQWDEDRAKVMLPVLNELLEAMLDWGERHGGS